MGQVGAGGFRAGRKPAFCLSGTPDPSEPDLGCKGL
jgi:hypothetical protein